MSLAVLAVGGCVSRADFERVKREQDQMRPKLAETQAAVDSLRRQVDALRTDLQDQSGRHGSGSSAALAEHERRIKNLEALSAAGTQPQAAVSAVIEPAVSGQPALDTAPAGAVQGTAAASIAMRIDAGLTPSGPGSEAFRTGMELYKQGQWDRSIAKFRECLQVAPKSDLADNAQYWIGESYYNQRDANNQRDYNRAIIELNEVLLKYPKGDRVPTALLALATAFADSGDKIDARLILQKLLSDYPASEEAKAGRQKLQAVAE